MSGMEGAVAIVTGGGTGIGAAVVRRLAARGVRCVVNYASSRDEAETLVAEVEGAIAVQADIAEDSACRALAAAAIEAFGRIDFLVNNAGRTTFANHEDLDALTADEKTLFDAASISESLLKEIESADTEHKDGSFARKASTSVLPFIAGIEQYSKAMDVFANRYR